MAGNAGQGEENPHIARPDAPGAGNRRELALDVDRQPLQRKGDKERGGRDVAELGAPFVRDVDEIAAADEGRCPPSGVLAITACPRRCHAGDAITSHRSIAGRAPVPRLDVSFTGPLTPRLW